MIVLLLCLSLLGAQRGALPPPVRPRPAPAPMPAPVPALPRPTPAEVAPVPALSDEDVEAALKEAGKEPMPMSVSLILGADQSGQLAEFGPSKSRRLAAGIAALAAVRLPAKSSGLGGSRLSAPLAPRAEYSSALDSLGRLVVTSRPAGAIVTVDGYRWENRTEADGYAAAGRRRIVVSDGKREVRVECVVAKESITMLRIDLDANTGACSSK